LTLASQDEGIDAGEQLAEAASATPATLQMIRDLLPRYDGKLAIQMGEQVSVVQMQKCGRFGAITGAGKPDHGGN
jgi:hypothetical protein